jgi:iron(III) transport system substrate-binding protein
VVDLGVRVWRAIHHRPCRGAIDRAPEPHPATETEVKQMNVLCLIFLSLSLLHSPLAATLQAASIDAGLMKAKKEAESRGFSFEASYDEIVARAKKEGALRALLGFDTPAVKALRDGFKKKYPFLNLQFEEHGNPEQSLRYLLELKSGRTSDWDIANVLNEAQHEYLPYLEKIDMRAMAEQGVLRIPANMINPESRNVIALSSTVDAVAYNKRLLPPELVPKTWEDFLKPEHSGRKFLADIRPNSIAGLVPAMGLEWVEAYARKLAAQQPVWVRGHTRYLNAMAVGEYRLFFGVYYHGVLRQKKRGSQDLEVSVLEPVPVRLTETHSIIKGTRRPNAAMLFFEYAASEEGQRILWEVEPFKSSIYAPSSKTEELARGKKISLGDWEFSAKQAEYMQKIAAAYGFPREEKK